LSQDLFATVKTTLAGARDRAMAAFGRHSRPETDDERAARRGRHGPHLLRWGVGGAVALLAAVVLFLFFFDWNWVRGPVGHIASARLGRTVVIAGDLDVHPWSFSPTVEAYGLRIGQPKWAGTGQMADIDKTVLRIQILDLLRGRTVLGLLQVEGADVHLVRAADGRANWQFGPKKKGQAAKLPAIRRLIIDNARLRLDDAQRKAVFKGVVSTRDSTTGEGAGRFQLTGDGDLNGARFSADVTGSPLLNISPDRPYQFEARVVAGATKISANGHIDRPFDLNVLGARFAISGSDLNDLYVLTGLALPNTGPYSVSAGLVRDHGRYHLNGLKGRIGDSDIAGQVTVETARDKPLLIADIRSRRLDFDDMGSLFGMAPATGKGETASPEQMALAQRQRATARLLPDSTLQVDRLRAMDARVKYRADAVNAPGLPLRRVSLEVNLEDGVMTLDPIAFSLDRGDIRGRARLDASKDTPRTDLDLRMTGARLENWITAKYDGQPVIQGGLVARLKVSGTGNSVHRAASSANGSLTVVVPNGEVRQAFAELLGVNLSKGLILLLSENPKKTPLNCAVADFQVRNGVAHANRIVADTGVVLVEGQGTINFEKETMNLRIEGDSKKPRLLRVFAPITVTGPLVKPRVGVETSGIIGQGGVAALLGAVISPLTAILPFVDPGLAKDANCAALISEGRRRGAPPVKAAR
jgi:uncharacterized protein involved in outer membrane biogenesis